MSYANKREELEMESSDRGLYKTDPEMIHKINNHEFPAFWPLIPLSNFTKDAYKTDQIHTTHQNGDEPLELHSSYELSIKGLFKNYSY